MASHYSNLSAILLFALLQCFAPLLHAHFDPQPHGQSGIHQHETVTLYCLDGEQSHCLNAQVQALDSPGAATTLTLPKQHSIDAGALALRLSSIQAQARLAAAPAASAAIPRWHFASPPTHAPPCLI